MPNRELIEAKLQKAIAKNDTYAIGRFQQMLASAPLPPPVQGGFVPALKVGGASALESIARPFEELTGYDTGAGAYADQVRANNPLAFGSLGDLVERPVTSVAEIIGQQGVPAAMTAAGALSGRAIGSRFGAGDAGAKIGGAVGGFLPNLAMQYNESRNRQEETGEGGKLAALGAAIPGAALDTAFGLERLLPGLRGAGNVIEPLENRALYAAKRGALMAPGEGLTEVAQSALTRASAGQDLTSPEAMREYLTGATAGVIGSGIIGGGISAFDKRAVAPPSPTPTAAVQPADEAELDPDQIDPETLLQDEKRYAPGAYQSSSDVVTTSDKVVNQAQDAIARPVVRPNGVPFKTIMEAAVAKRQLGLAGHSLAPADGGGFALYPPAVEPQQEDITLTTTPSEEIQEPVVSTEGIDVSEAPAPIEIQATQAQQKQAAADELRQQAEADRQARLATLERQINQATALEDDVMRARLVSERDALVTPASTKGIEVQEAAPENISVGGQLALPAPDKTATGAFAPPVQEGQVPKEPDFIFGRPTPNGRVDFAGPMDARRYAKEIGAIDLYDVTKIDGKYALKERVEYPSVAGLEVGSEVAPNEGRRETVNAETVPTTEGIDVSSQPSKPIEIPPVETEPDVAPKGAGTNIRVTEPEGESITMEGGLPEPRMEALPAPKVVSRYTGPDGKPVDVTESDIANLPKAEKGGVRERVLSPDEQQTRANKNRDALLAKIALRPAVTEAQANQRRKRPIKKGLSEAVPHPVQKGKFVFVTKEEADLLDLRPEPPTPPAPKRDLLTKPEPKLEARADETDPFAPSPAPAAEKKKVGRPAKQKTAADVAEKARSSLIGAFRRDGINQSEQKDIIGERAGTKTRGLIASVFRRDGKPLDQWIETFIEQGYFANDGDAGGRMQDARDLIAAVLEGDRQAALDPAQREEYDRLLAAERGDVDEIIEQDYEPSEVTDADREAMTIMARAKEIDPEGFEDAYNQIDPYAEGSDGAFYEWAKRTVEDSDAEARRFSEEDSGQEEGAGGQDRAGRNDNSLMQARGEQAELLPPSTQQKPVDREDFKLTSQGRTVDQSDAELKKSALALQRALFPDRSAEVLKKIAAARSQLEKDIGVKGVASLERQGILQLVTFDELPARIRGSFLEEIVDPLFTNAKLLRDSGVRISVGPQGNRFLEIPLDAITNLDSPTLERGRDVGGIGVEGAGDSGNAKARSVKLDGSREVALGSPASPSSSFGQKPSGLEGRPNSRPVDAAKNISNLLVGSPLIAKFKRLVEVPFKNLAVDSGVLLGSDKLKIVDGVVKSIPVDMMDMLVSGKGPANQPFHNQPMGSLLPGSVIESVSLGENVASPALAADIQRLAQVMSSRNLDKKTEAIYDADSAVAYIIVDRVDKSRLKSLILHELGEHAGLPGMIGLKGYSRLVTEVRGLIESSKDVEFQKAVDHVRKNYGLDESSTNFVREVIARYAEKPRSDSWWTRLVGQIRQWLFDNGFVNVNESDLQFLVQKSLRRAIAGQTKYIQPEKDVTINAKTGEEAAPAGTFMESRSASTSVLPDADTKDALFGLLSRRSVVAKLQNKLNRWPEAQAYIEKKMGGKLKYTENVANAAILSPGKIAADAAYAESQYQDKIINILKAGKHSLEKFDDFAYHRHAPERNAAIAQINPALQDGGSGISTKDANAAIASLTAKERADFTRAGDLLVEMNKWRLKKQMDAGLITQGEYDVLTKKYQYYVPLKTVDDVDDTPDSMGVAGFTVRGKEYKQALGRRSKANSPFIVSVQDTQRAILRINKQNPSLALWELAQNPNAQELFSVYDPKDAPPEFRMQKVYKVVERDAAGKPIKEKNAAGQMVNKMKDEVRYGVDPSWSGSKNIIPIKVNGEQKYVIVKDDVAAQQFKNMDEVKLGPILESMNRATSLLGRLFTQFNPAFVPVNFFRDTFTVTFNSMSVPGMSPGKVLAGVAPSIAAIKNTIYGDKSHPLSAMYQQFIDDGSSIGGLGIDTYADLQKQIERKAVDLMAGKSNEIQKGIGMLQSIIQGVAKANEVIENATRFSVYRNAVETFELQNKAAGMNAKDAMADARQRGAILARQISVDFNQRGEYSRAMNALFLFFNAAVQGLAGFIRFTTGPNARKAQMGLFALAAAGVAARLTNQGEDDELGEDKALAFESKAAINIPIMVGDKVVTIPLQYIYNIPFVFGYRMADMALTGRVSKNLGMIFTSTSGALSPLGEPKQASGPAGFVAKTLTPTLLLPLVDMVDNTNSFGGPLAKKPSLNDKAPAPRAYDYWKSTSEASVAVSEFLNYASGGTKTEPGAVNVPPEWLDYIVGYYGGGPVRFGMQVAGTIKNGLDPLEETPPSKWPIVSRIVTEAQPEYYVSKRFYELSEKMAYVEKAIDAREQVSPEDRAVMGIHSSVEKSLKKLNTERRKASAEENDERVQQYEDRIRAEQIRFIRAYNVAHGELEQAYKGATAPELAATYASLNKPATAGLLLDLDK